MGLDERVSAGHGLSIGLVTEIVGPSQLRDRAHELARRLAEKSPIAMQGTVKAIWQSLDMSASGTCTIPQIYPQLGNPLSRTPMPPSRAQRSKFAIRALYRKVGEKQKLMLRMLHSTLGGSAR